MAFGSMEKVSGIRWSKTWTTTLGSTTYNNWVHAFKTPDGLVSLQATIYDTSNTTGNWKEVPNLQLPEEFRPAYLMNVTANNAYRECGFVEIGALGKFSIASGRTTLGAAAYFAVSYVAADSLDNYKQV